MKKIIKFLKGFSFRSIYFNFKYLPFRQAIKLPILLSGKVYLRKTSGKIIIDYPLRTGLIEIGYGDTGIFDDKRSRTIWEVSGTVIFKGKCFIGHGSKITVGDEGILTFGDKFSMTAESTIIAFKDVSFGNECLLSWDILIMDTDFHKLKDKSGAIINNPAPVLVGNKVWIGCRCTILKGTVIPDNCVIAANSLLSKSLENESTLYAGIPCKAIKDNISWEK